MSEPIRRLPDAELEVMQAVWRFTPPVPRAELERAVNETRPMAQTTLLTLLTRLSEKGFLRIEKQGRGSVYTPLVSERDYRAAQSRRFVDSLFGGSMSAFASALCDSGLSRDELDELRRLLGRDPE
ncbi:MAG: BlaI/MecI/CopY family transcriptional regulator [Oscillospiraceae bacterium]|nr:BlaI/MecI/CopY family transcriptional regulator [Oscillospiraceae bacterium]